MMKEYIIPTIEIVNIEIQPLLQASTIGSNDYKKDDPVLSPHYHPYDEEDEEKEEEW